MSHLKECPKCGADISGTWEDADPSVGIDEAGWFCENCSLFIPYEDDDFDLDQP